ncbi:MAG: hypothetical protein DRP79_00385, partial [Planctomycetota bacterium]
YVYVLRCADDSLYVGTSADLEARVACHNNGKGAKYTRSAQTAPMRILRIPRTRRLSLNGTRQDLRSEILNTRIADQGRERSLTGVSGSHIHGGKP